MDQSTTGFWITRADVWGERGEGEERREARRREKEEEEEEDQGETNALHWNQKA